jgi:glycosyltransferase involved in cell wall biosynthesis
MNILITVGIFPPDIGGPAVFVPKIAKHLENQGHEIQIICLANDLSVDNEDQLNVRRIKRSTNLLLRWIKTLFLIITYGRNSDVIFVNGLGVEAAIANIFLRKRIVRKIVGDPVWERFYNKNKTKKNFDDFQKINSSWNMKIQKLLRNWSINSSEIIITPSNHLKQFVNDLGSINNVLKINNGIEIIDLGREAEPNKINNLLVNSRLVVQKNIDLVIEAFGILNDSRLKLEIIGEGSEFQRLNELITNLEIQNNVILIGKVDNNSVSKYLEKSQLFIQASDYEGLPHSILEAINYEVPVLSTEAGGCKDLLHNGDRGFIISSPPNKYQIAESINFIINNPTSAHQKALEAKSYIRENHNFQTQAQLYTEVIEGLEQN